MKPPVNSKYDFVQRFIAGEFGNRTPVWPDLATFLREPTPLLDREFCLRSFTFGAPTKYNLDLLEVPTLWTPDHYISEMVPRRIEQYIFLQGEVCRLYSGLHLWFSLLPMPMKLALEQGGRGADCTAAKIILETALDASSLEWLYHLLDTYPDHVVEFSAYRCQYGMVPNMNTLFWEVRNY